MPEAFGAALATPGLPWLLLAIGVAGIVRGFTGFGTALIFVPVAGIFLAPQVVVGVMMLTGLVSSAALLPRARGQSGRRFSGRVNRPQLAGIGAAAGGIGGLTGLTGPAVILFYLAGQSVAQRVRANTILFLAALDVVIVANLLFRGAVTVGLVTLALVLAVPYLITSLIGQALFDPRHERLYRWAAYAVIGLAVLSGLPLWT